MSGQQHPSGRLPPVFTQPAVHSENHKNFFGHSA